MITDFYNKLVAAGLPVISATDDGFASFSRSLENGELRKYIQIVNPGEYTKLIKQLAAKTIASGVPNWVTWTPEQLETWCNNNLMTDAAIDALSIPAALKTNVKANNAFTRNAGKMIIALRDQLWTDL